MRRISSSTDPFSRNSPENQPDESARSCAPNSGRKIAASRGNLPPASMPQKPAARASAKQVSSGVSPPNSGMSSLLQPIGATPSRTLDCLCWIVTPI